MCSPRVSAALSLAPRWLRGGGSFLSASMRPGYYWGLRLSFVRPARPCAASKGSPSTEASADPSRTRGGSWQRAPGRPRGPGSTDRGYKCRTRVRSSLCTATDALLATGRARASAGVRAGVRACRRVQARAHQGIHLAGSLLPPPTRWGPLNQEPGVSRDLRCCFATNPQCLCSIFTAVPLARPRLPQEARQEAPWQPRGGDLRARDRAGRSRPGGSQVAPWCDNVGIQNRTGLPAARFPEALHSGLLSLESDTLQSEHWPAGRLAHMKHLHLHT